MATKEHSTPERGACVCDCQIYRVKPAMLREHKLAFIWL